MWAPTRLHDLRPLPSANIDRKEKTGQVRRACTFPARHEKRPSSPALAALWLLSLLAAGGLGWWLGKQAENEARVRNGPPATARMSDASAPQSPPSAPKPAALTSANATPLSGLKRAEAALRVANADQRRREFYVFLNTMTAGQAGEVEQLIRSLQREGMNLYDEWSAFYTRWGELDPVTALEEMEKRRVGDDSDRSIIDPQHRIMAAWASLHPQQVQAWLEAHPDHPESVSLWVSFIEGMSQVDLPGATALTLEHTAGDKTAQGLAMGALAESAIRQRGKEGMRAWFEELPDEGKASAMEHVHRRNKSSAPGESAVEKAAAWLAAQASSSWRQDRFYQETANDWARLNPQAATQWSANLPAGKDPSDPFPGLRSSIAAWVEKNPEEVSAWLTAQQGRPYYDTAAAGVAQHYLQQEGEEAAGQTWLGSISSSEIKQRVLDSVEERRARDQHYQLMRKLHRRSP